MGNGVNLFGIIMATASQTLYERLLNPQTGTYDTPDQLLRSAISYLQWCDKYPLQSEELFHYKGMVKRSHSKKMRAPTRKGLGTFLGLTEAKLNKLRAQGDDWEDAMQLIEQALFTHKFEGAAAGLLNAGIVSRELGLAERSEITGRDGEPLQQVVQYQLPDNGRDPHEPADTSDG